MELYPLHISNYSLKFRDFIPNQLKSGGIFSKAQYESLEKLLADIDKWKEANPKINVVHVETVVLPNIHNPRETGSTDPELAVMQGDGYKSYWHQFFRVWYA